jgi:uncharacterized protein (DUF362 family)
MNERVVEITKVQEDTKVVLKNALQKLNYKGRRIFIKPNICAPVYTPGAVTNPRLVYELVSLLRGSAEEVLVGESDIYNCPCNIAFKGTGIADAVIKAGGKTVNLSHDKTVEVKLKNSQIKRLMLPKSLLEADVIIDMPVMKTHEFKVYSGAIKNLFGCIPDSRRIFLHPYLNETLLQLYFVLRPEMTIMDAIVAMEGNGPTKGKPVNLGLILTGNDALSVDVVATRIMRLEWGKIDYLNYIALKTGFREEEICLSGYALSRCARQFMLPKADLPVRLQALIYRSPFLTKTFFYSQDIAKLLQRATATYRKLSQVRTSA